MEESHNSNTSVPMTLTVPQIVSYTCLAHFLVSRERMNLNHEDTDSEIIRPYSFEPVASSIDSPDEPESDSSRLDNTDW